MIIILVIILLIILYYINNNVNVIFYSKSDISKILHKDNYNYFSNMNDINLKIRNINNISDYIDNIKYHFYNLNIIDKLILKYNINKAHNTINNINYPWFIGNKLKNIPWLIACSKNKEYEFGFPHTRQNIIILNTKNIYSSDLYKTLIHERIHIYQKLFPDDIEHFINEYNFKKISKLTNVDRVNPDVNEYKYSKDNIVYECIIENNKVKCTNDNSIYEHPYEFMAYLIADNI